MNVTFVTTAPWNIIRDYSNFFICENITILSKLFKLCEVIIALRKLQAIYWLFFNRLKKCIHWGFVHDWESRFIRYFSSSNWFWWPCWGFVILYHSSVKSASCISYRGANNLRSTFILALRVSLHFQRILDCMCQHDRARSCLVSLPFDGLYVPGGSSK